MTEEKTRFEPRVRQGSKFSPQTRERAVRLVLEHGSEFPNERRALQTIADKFGISVGRIERLNPDVDAQTLNEGTELKLH